MSARQWKLQIMRRMYECGYSAGNIRQLFRFIAWLMWLPEELEHRFWNELQTWEEEQHMPYVTSVERIGREKGRADGLLKGRAEDLLAGIELGLDLKFGAAGLALMPEIRQLADVAVLQAVHQAIKSASTPEELRRIYQQGAHQD